MTETVQSTEGVVAPDATSAPNTGHAVDGDTPVATEPESKESQQPASDPVKDLEALKRQNEALRRDKYQARGREQSEREARERLEREVMKLNEREPQEGEKQPSPQEMYAQAAFDIRCNRVAQEGEKSIPGFKDALTNLTPFRSLMTNDRMEAILEADEPAKVLHYLGSNLDEANEILSKTPIAMARAIAKLETKLSTNPAISKAPAPLEPNRSKSTPGEPADIDAWMERENAKDAKRRANR